MASRQYKKLFKQYRRELNRINKKYTTKYIAFMPYVLKYLEFIRDYLALVANNDEKNSILPEKAVQNALKEYDLFVEGSNNVALMQILEPDNFEELQKLTIECLAHYKNFWLAITDLTLNEFSPDQFERIKLKV